MADLSDASAAILRQIVVGSRIIDEIPPELFEMKLVRAMPLKNVMNGHLRTVWVATKLGRIKAAETSASDET